MFLSKNIFFFNTIPIWGCNNFHTQDIYMKYFKWYVLSAFIITIKRTRTYKRSRYPYRAVLQRPCSPLDIKYLVPLTINPISIILYRYLLLSLRHDSCGDIRRDSEHDVALHDDHPPAQLPRQTRPLDQLQRRHPRLLLPQHYPRGFQHLASG